MTSFADALGLDEAELRRVARIRYAYSRGREALAFPAQMAPAGDLTGSRSVMTDWEAQLENATVLRGAACAALVFDQLLAMKFLDEAALHFAQAGTFYGHFLWAALGVYEAEPSARPDIRPVAQMLLEEGVGAATDENPATASALLNPTQLGYLVLATALSGGRALAVELLSSGRLPAIAELFGAQALNTRDVLRITVNGDSRIDSDVLTVGDALRRHSRWRSTAPEWKKLLPWNVGIDCDAVLLLLNTGRQDQTDPPRQDRETQVVDEVTRQLDRVRRRYLQAVISGSLDVAVRVRLNAEPGSRGQLDQREAVWLEAN
jgi:hypothetical protein